MITIYTTVLIVWSNSWDGRRAGCVLVDYVCCALRPAFGLMSPTRFATALLLRIGLEGLKWAVITQNFVHFVCFMIDQTLVDREEKLTRDITYCKQ